MRPPGRLRGNGVVSSVSGCPVSTRDDSDQVKYRWTCRSANKLINMSRRDYFKKRLLNCDTQSHSKRCRTVDELLHSRSTDKTRTDDENKQLCTTFADFFLSEIVQLKSQISAKLAFFTHSSFSWSATLWSASQPSALCHSCWGL